MNREHDDDDLLRIPRRRFLGAGAVVFVAASVGPIALFGCATPAGQRDHSRAYFDERSGKRFEIDAGGWQAVELVDISGVDADPAVHQFDVTFRGSANIREGTYAVAPPDGDPFQLHMQPVASDDDWHDYRAHFSIVK